MKITCIIVDDEPLAIKVLESCVKRIANLELLATFTNAVKALEFLNTTKVDVLFADIQMPDMMGFELIEKVENKPFIIFTTAYSDHAIKAFKVDALDYLLKPIEFKDFEKAVNKAYERIQAKLSTEVNEVQTNKDFLFIKSEYKVIRVNFNNILYIQGMSEYVQIHLLVGKPIMTLLSLKSLETKLPSLNFMRVHKSYIVNLDEVKTIERNEIVYDNGVVIPVSQQYKEKFQEFVDENFML